MQSADRATNSHFAICGVAFPTDSGGSQPGVFHSATPLSLARPLTPVELFPSQRRSRSVGIGAFEREILEAAYKAKDRTSALRDRRRETRENEGREGMRGNEEVATEDCEREERKREPFGFI